MANTAKLCIQCKDALSGQVGTFLAQVGVEKEHVAVSPVFPGLTHFFAWADQSGWKKLPYSKEFPVGLYAQSAA